MRRSFDNSIRSFRNATCWLIAAILLPATTALAHGPFDHSSRLVVSETQLELVVTMGADATQKFLAAAGRPAEEIWQILSLTPGQSYQGLPDEVGAGMFEVKADGDQLAPESFSVATDGLDSHFKLVFPRPAGEILEIRAKYFNGIDSMKQGTFVAHDLNDQSLGTALLSRANDSVSISLPVTSRAGRAVWEPVTGVEHGAGDSNVATQDRVPMKATSSRLSFGDFLKLGVEHILMGFDHLLFLVALLIGVRKLGPMVGIITCFTLAHSVTLGLAALELVTVSSRIVEPLIALSIIVVAVENLVRAEATADRYWLAGGFGLIHGFGFASVLRETGLAQAGQSILMPLFSFNLGVELGQLTLAAVFVPLLLALRRWPAFVRYGTPAVSALVITLSGYWFLQRTLW